jgi:hypothetical protein
LILVGDFKPDEVQALAVKYFERIPRGPKNAPDVVTLEVKQIAEKRMDAEADTNPQVDILWHTVPFEHKDSYALEILGQILSTRTGAFIKGWSWVVVWPQVYMPIKARKNGPASLTLAGRLKMVTRRRKWSRAFTKISKN